MFNNQRSNLKIINVCILMTIFLNDLFESLEVWTYSKASLEILDVFPSACWCLDGVVEGENIAAKFIHLILKCPVIGNTKRVDNTVVPRQERVQTYKLVSVHLLVLAGTSDMPNTAYSLQNSRQSSWRRRRRCLSFNLTYKHSV